MQRETVRIHSNVFQYYFPLYLSITLKTAAWVKGSDFSICSPIFFFFRKWKFLFNLFHGSLDLLGKLLSCMSLAIDLFLKYFSENHTSNIYNVCYATFFASASPNSRCFYENCYQNVIT